MMAAFQHNLVESVIFIDGELGLAKELCNLIVNYESLCSKTPSSVSSLISDDAESFTTSFVLRSKYYAADISITNQVYPECEGYILLVQMDTNMFAYPPLESTAAVKILSAISDNIDLTIPSSWFEWAADNGFEVIIIDRLNPIEGFTEREKNGLPRLMEALEANMWRSMIRSSRSGVAHTSSMPSDTPRQEEVESESSTTTTTSSSLRNCANVTITESFVAGSSDGAFRVSGPDSDDSLDVEHDMDAFASMLAEAREVRAGAISGTLSDDERRRRAAEVARRFCSIAYLDDDDEEDRKISK